MKRYAVTLTGETPLLMHNDNLQWSEAMDAYLSHPTRRNEAAVYLVVLLYVVLAVPVLAVKRVK